MGCGCNKRKVVPTLPAADGSVSTAALSAEAKTYDVVDSEGAVVASTTNIVFARVEARRTGGTVVPRTATSASSA